LKIDLGVKKIFPQIFADLFSEQEAKFFADRRVMRERKKKGLTFTFPDLNEVDRIPAQGRNDSSKK